jgi:hypothetical protein
MRKKRAAPRQETEKTALSSPIPFFEIKAKWRSGVAIIKPCSASVEEALTNRRAAKTRNAIIAANLALEFVVVSEFFV